MAPPGRLCAGRAWLVGGYGRRALWRVGIGTYLRQRPGLSGRDEGVADHTAVDRGATAARTRPALMMRPKVLLLDEPTAALDVASVAAVESLIKARTQTGLAVLWVTHDAEQAKRVAHRLLVVEAGQVREEAPEWTLISP